MWSFDFCVLKVMSSLSTVLAELSTEIWSPMFAARWSAAAGDGNGNTGRN